MESILLVTIRASELRLSRVFREILLSFLNLSRASTSSLGASDSSHGPEEAQVGGEGGESEGGRALCAVKSAQHCQGAGVLAPCARSSSSGVHLLEVKRGANANVSVPADAGTEAHRQKPRLACQRGVGYASAPFAARSRPCCQPSHVHALRARALQLAAQRRCMHVHFSWRRDAGGRLRDVSSLRGAGSS